MLFFETVIGALAPTLTLLPFSTLTLLSALTFNAETAVVIGATTEPMMLDPFDPPAKAGEALSAAREAATTMYFIVSSLLSRHLFTWLDHYVLLPNTYNL